MIAGLLQFTLSALLFLVLLGFSVFVHEAGHFLVSAWKGVATEGFYVGVPMPYPYLKRTQVGLQPRIGFYKKYLGTWKGTPIYFSPFLIGGFVKPIRDEEDPRSFQKAHPVTKILILIAGPLANLVLAGILIFIFHRIQYPELPFLQYIIESFVRVGRNVVFYAVSIIQALFNLFSGQLSGPLGIFQAVQQETAQSTTTGSWIAFIPMLAGLNLSLLVANLLPIGLLDGAKLILAVVELTFRRRIIWLERIFEGAGTLGLLFIFVVITVGDIRRFFP